MLFVKARVISVFGYELQWKSLRPFFGEAFACFRPRGDLAWGSADFLAEFVMGCCFDGLTIRRFGLDFAGGLATSRFE